MTWRSCHTTTARCKTTLLETTPARTGFKINRKKTELMKMNTTANAPVTVGGEPIREVESFVYLSVLPICLSCTEIDQYNQVFRIQKYTQLRQKLLAAVPDLTASPQGQSKSHVQHLGRKAAQLIGCELFLELTTTIPQKNTVFYNF